MAEVGQADHKEMKNCWPNGLSPAEAAVYQKGTSPKTDTVLL